MVDVEWASEAPATCASCLAPIRWVVTLGDKRMPLDVDPHPDGNVVIVRTPGGQVRARVLTGEHLPAQDTAYRAHFATCPNASDHRRRRAIVTAKCHGCHGPMDPILGRTDLYHPTCAPDPTAMRAALDTVRATAEQGALDL